MHYLVTGHTGFKGSWLSLWLTERGHTVSGLSLDPIPGALYTTARIGELLENDLRVDIRDAPAVSDALHAIEPDVVFHLAAQPLVRESYANPRTTFETNVMGTLNVLEAVSSTPSVKAQVIITTDKVYRNVNRVAGYVETDPLGGDDPYSSSKAMADILAQSWVKSFPSAPTAIARGGNVIGGGDVSPNRLLPDLLRSFEHGTTATLRYPGSVRPWQHVLDCLSGYLMLADTLLAGGGTGTWNIGPGRESFMTVGQVADLAATLWGDGAAWTTDGGVHLHEANLLALDASRIMRELHWHNRLGFDKSVAWTVEWQKSVLAGTSERARTVEQIHTFLELP